MPFLNCTAVMCPGMVSNLKSLSRLQALLDKTKFSTLQGTSKSIEHDLSETDIWGKKNISPSVS